MITTVAVIATGVLHFDQPRRVRFPAGRVLVLARLSVRPRRGVARRRLRLPRLLRRLLHRRRGEGSRPRHPAIDRDQHGGGCRHLPGDQPVDHRRRALARLRARGRRSPNAQFVVSVFMERIYGSTIASVFTLMILWTAFGSVFALLLGYSRIPYAAARDGYFFKPFARLHPTEGFPHVSLIVLGVVSILSSFFSLGVVIDALIATRILVQFIGSDRRRRAASPPRARRWRGRSASGCTRARRHRASSAGCSSSARPASRVILFGLGVLALGVLCFLAWSLRLRQWPFGGAVSRT